MNESFERDALQLRMSYINPGMMDWRNLRLFDYCIQRLPSDAPLLEIGSYAALSLNNLVHLLRKYGKSNPIFSTDNWMLFRDGLPPEQLIGGSHITRGAYCAYVIATFRRNVEMFSSDRLPHHLELSSDAFFEKRDARVEQTDFFGHQAKLGGPISFAYIDGDHTYEQSRRDFDHVDRHLEIGGFIVFDDSADSARGPGGHVWGSIRTAREAAADPRYRVVDRSHHYCIQKIRRACGFS